MKIQSKVPNKAYKDNWERIFRNQVENTKRESEGQESPEVGSRPNPESEPGTQTR